MIMHCELCTYIALSRHLRPSSCTEFIYIAHPNNPSFQAAIQYRMFISIDVGVIMQNKASRLFERISVDLKFVYADNN